MSSSVAATPVWAGCAVNPSNLQVRAPHHDSFSRLRPRVIESPASDSRAWRWQWRSRHTMLVAAEPSQASFRASGSASKESVPAAAGSPLHLAQRVSA